MVHVEYRKIILLHYLKFNLVKLIHMKEEENHLFCTHVKQIDTSLFLNKFRMHNFFLF